KVFCGLGRELATTGRLNEGGSSLALTTLERFKGWIERLECTRVEAVATAAVRDASDGNLFVEQAEKCLGADIEVLPGDEEVLLSARGVLCGIPDAQGIVGDLGGGSLEVVSVSGGTIGRRATLPIGPLRLKDKSKDSLRLSRVVVDEALSK